MCYNWGVQGDRRIVQNGGLFVDFCQISFNGQASLWRSPVTNLASGFPEQKLAKGVAGFLFALRMEMAKKKIVETIWVYLMKDQRSGFYKIGKSKYPAYRERTLQAQVPLIDLVGAWAADPEDEFELHRMYKDKRLRGEWFALESKDVLEIQWYFMDNPTYFATDAGFAIYEKHLAKYIAENPDSIEARSCR